jgi:predicted metal-dependent enzyme (double-stranded beta helix superfamily)
VQAAARAFFSKHSNLQLPVGVKSFGATTRHGRNLLYKDTQLGFVVLAIIWPPGSQAPPHDRKNREGHFFLLL